MIHRSAFLTLAIVGTSAVVAGATPKLSTESADHIPKTKPLTKLAYIYKSDKDSAESFKKLLDKAGFRVDLIPFRMWKRPTS